MCPIKVTIAASATRGIIIIIIIIIVITAQSAGVYVMQYNGVFVVLSYPVR